jgi:hypothetical protein
MLALSVVAVFALAGPIHAGDLDQADPPAPTMNTLDEIYDKLEEVSNKVDYISIESDPDPRTLIMNGLTIIAESGSYYFGQNVSSTGNGIVVDVDHVTIDLMGFSLIGPGPGGTRGIVVQPGVANTEIRNGTVAGFGEWGIYNQGTGTRLIDMRLVNNGSGIFGGGDPHLQVIDCVIW